MQSSYVDLEMFRVEQDAALRIPTDALIETVVSLANEIIRAVKPDASDGVAAS
jgi:hypothetical protein